MLLSFSVRKYLSPLNTLDLKGLLISIFQFLTLYGHDLVKATFIKRNSFLKFWFGWKIISEIFYSILTYNSIIGLVRDSKDCEFISWYENQITLEHFH